MIFRKNSLTIPTQLPVAAFVLMLLLGATTAGAQIRTVLVSPVPGDPVASGTALRNALAGISSPSATNRWLLKIEPGIYDVGGTSLAMRPYVDIEGSGIEATTIRGNGDASGFQNATILGADNAELRLLTVQVLPPTSSSPVIAMANYQASPRVYRVKIVSQGQVAWGMRNIHAAPLIEECEISVTSTATGFNHAYGLVFGGYPPSSRRSSILRSKIAVSGASQNYGVYMADSLSLTSIRDSRFDVVGGSLTQGIYANGLGWSGHESLSIRDTEINSAGGSTASYGLRFDSGARISLNVFGSMVWGHVAPTTYGIYTETLDTAGGIQGSTITGFTKAVQFGGSISIASTFLQGGPTIAGGWLGCMGVWDENGVFYAQGCPQ